jgi:hypothetical protein
MFFLHSYGNLATRQGCQHCLKEITVLFAEKAGRKGSSWTLPFRHLPDKHPKLLGSAGGKNYSTELKKSWFKFLWMERCGVQFCLHFWDSRLLKVKTTPQRSMRVWRKIERVVTKFGQKLGY